MVEGIEGLDTKFKAAVARFTNGEALEERNVPVVPARAADRALAHISPGAQSGVSEVAGKEAADCSRIGDRTGQIRTVAATRDTVVALIAT